VKTLPQAINRRLYQLKTSNFPLYMDTQTSGGLFMLGLQSYFNFFNFVSDLGSIPTNIHLMVARQVTFSSEYFPPSFMCKGLYIKIKRFFEPFEEEIWLEVLTFDGEYATGIGYQKERVSSYQKKFTFHYNEIMSVRGNNTWNIEHQYVFCSTRILKGEKIGYFHETVDIRMNRPLYYGLSFVSIMDLKLKSEEIIYCEVLLKTLLQLDDSIISYLGRDEYFWGLIRKENGEYEEPSKDFIISIDPKEYPFLYDELYSLAPFRSENN